MEYDVIIIGAGPGGIFSAYELMKKSPETRVAVFEEGNTLEKRKCPIDGKKVKSCIKCPTCAIMNGFGGAGAFSDGKYNITNDFGGTLYEYIGRDQSIDLMKYVDTINTSHGGEHFLYQDTGRTVYELDFFHIHLVHYQAFHSFDMCFLLFVQHRHHDTL